jgi:hypothetical protein
MDVFDEELLRFWDTLNNCKVQYIMIGGVAVNLHGYQRTTADMDMWIKDSPENRISLRKAFNEYGLGDFESLQHLEFIPGSTYFHLRNNLRIDIMTTVKGLEKYSFDTCLAQASIATIYNIAIPFLHLNHLLESKKATNRSKDKLDILELEKIQRLTKGTE